MSKKLRKHFIKGPLMEHVELNLEVDILKKKMNILLNEYTENTRRILIEQIYVLIEKDS